MPQTDLFPCFLRELKELAQRQPVMCMVAGPNGAGKTTLWKEHLKTSLQGFFGESYINADEMQKEFPPEIRNAEEGTRIAQRQATELRAQHLQAAYGKHFIYETVFSDEFGFKLRELEDGRAHGYATVLIFVGLDDVELGKARVKKRVSQGGHNVKPETQEARFARVLLNAAQALDIVDLAILLDNSRANAPDAVRGKYQAQSLHKSGHMLAQAPQCHGWHDTVQGLRGGGFGRD